MLKYLKIEQQQPKLTSHFILHYKQMNWERGRGVEESTSSRVESKSSFNQYSNQLELRHKIGHLHLLAASSFFGNKRNLIDASVLMVLNNSGIKMMNTLQG